MTKYKYVLKGDQHTSGYGGKWLNIDTPVTVIASTFEEAREKANNLLSPPRNDTNGWKFFVSKAEEIEEAPEPLPVDVTPPIITRNKFRMRGIR